MKRAYNRNKQKKELTPAQIAGLEKGRATAEFNRTQKRAFEGTLVGALVDPPVTVVEPTDDGPEIRPEDGQNTYHEELPYPVKNPEWTETEIAEIKQILKDAPPGLILPSVEEAQEAVEQIQQTLSPGPLLSPVGILIALHGYFQLFYRASNVSDLDHTMLDVQTGATWYAKTDYKKNVVFLQRKPRVGEVTFYELDEAWFKALGYTEMPEVYFDPELQRYIPIL